MQTGFAVTCVLPRHVGTHNCPQIGSPFLFGECFGAWGGQDAPQGQMWATLGSGGMLVGWLLGLGPTTNHKTGHLCTTKHPKCTQVPPKQPQMVIVHPGGAMATRPTGAPWGDGPWHCTNAQPTTKVMGALETLHKAHNNPPGQAPATSWPLCWLATCPLHTHVPPLHVNDFFKSPRHCCILLRHIS